MSKPEQKSTAEPRLPLRGLAMILLAIAALFITWGVFMLSGGTGSSGEGEGTQAASSSATAPAESKTKTSAAQSSSPAPSSADNTAVASSAAEQESAAPPQDPQEAPAPSGGGTQGGKAPVSVLNNSTVQGLAHRVADDVRNHDFEVSEVGNYSESTFPASVVYFTPGHGDEESTARALADFLGVSATPRDAQAEHLPAGVVLVITQDLQR